MSQTMGGVRSAVRWQCETLAMMVLLGAVLVVGETSVDDRVGWRDQRRRARAFALAGAVIPSAADPRCPIYCIAVATRMSSLAVAERFAVTRQTELLALKTVVSSSQILWILPDVRLCC